MNVHGFVPMEHPLRGGAAERPHPDFKDLGTSNIPAQKRTKSISETRQIATKEIKLIRKDSRMGRDYAPGTVMESIRRFDQKNPVMSKVLAYSSILALSAGIGVAIDKLADFLAHITERQNDKVGTIMGTIVGVLLALQGTTSLAGMQKRLEMRWRSRDFAADSKSPAGQARQMIEERCLPLHMAMIRNAKALNGVGHEQLVINNADVFDALNYINENNIPKKIWKTYLIEMDKLPEGVPVPHFKATTNVEHLHIRAGKYYVSKYYSANHLLQRDWVNSFDYNADRLKAVLEKTVSAINSHEPGRNIADIKSDIKSKEEERNRLDREKKVRLSKNEPHTDLLIKITTLDQQIATLNAEDFAFQLKQLQISQKALDKDLASGSGKDAEATKEKTKADEKNLFNSVMRSLQMHDEGSAKFDQWLQSDAAKPTIESLINYTREQLIGSKGGVKNGVTNLDRAQLEKDELYVNLSNALRGSYGDEAFKNRTWVRIDELTKMSYIHMGLREAGMYNMIRMYGDAFHEAISGASDPSTQARNAGTSITMYFPMVILGSIVTVLLAGISATPTAPPPRVTESGHAMAKGNGNATTPSGTTPAKNGLAGGTGNSMIVGGALPNGMLSTGHESPLLNHSSSISQSSHHVSSSQQSQQQAQQYGQALPAYQAQLQSTTPSFFTQANQMGLPPSVNPSPQQAPPLTTKLTA